jgi:hypothetical protein
MTLNLYNRRSKGSYQTGAQNYLIRIHLLDDRSIHIINREITIKIHEVLSLLRPRNKVAAEKDITSETKEVFAQKIQSEK